MLGAGQVARPFALSVVSSIQRARMADAIADRTVVQGRLAPSLVERAVARARALALPSLQASGTDSAINSATSIGSGRGREDSRRHRLVED